MKTLKTIALLLMTLLLASACSMGVSDPKYRIIKVELEGGFWGLIDAQQNKYRPKNLPESLKQHGQCVMMEYEILEGEMSIQMWGQRIRIANVSAVPDEDCKAISIEQFPLRSAPSL